MDEKKEKNKLLVALGAVAAFLMVLLPFAASWFAVCVIMKALSWCFSFPFSWKISTGIWIIVILIASAFSGGKKKK